jgi:outer membrane protein assembly factor BamD
MEKPDRDRTEAREAEAEFQTFLQKYPKDPLADKAMQHLREVQEIIAEGDFRVAYFYYVKGDRRAAAARLIGVTRRYPLYSHSDKALWMLGDIFEKSEKKEVAALYYAQIVKNYPLSSMAANAKSKLVAFKVPVPQPDPKAQAWMTAEQNAPRPKVSLAKRPMGLLKSGPEGEMRAAARVGTPNLEPEADNSSATDVLTGGNSSRIVVGGGGTSSTNGNSTGIVATVTPGGSKTDSTATDNNASDAPTPTDATAPGTAAPEAAQPETTPAATATPGESTSAAPAATGEAPAATPGTAETGTTATGAAATTPATGDGTAAPADGTAAPATTDAAKTGSADNNQKESSSKKKKGVRKLVPW